MRRSLYSTLKMLNAAGIDAGAKLYEDKLYVYVRPSDVEGMPFAASFTMEQRSQAADWIVACVVQHYPKSDLAKLWRVIADAVAALPR